MLQILNFRMRRAFWENFGENCRRERQKIVPSRSRKTRMKPSKTGKPLPKSQLDFECGPFDLLGTSPYTYQVMLPLGFRVVLVTTTSIHLHIHSYIIIAKSRRSVNTFCRRSPQRQRGPLVWDKRKPLPPFPLCSGAPFSCCTVISKGKIVKSWNHRLNFHKILLFCQKIVQTLPPSDVLY